MRNLVALRVKIHRGETGGHKFPPFNDIESNLRDEMDWSHFIDKFGGWHYDKLCGFNEVDTYSNDPDVWYGCFLVPDSFANAALTMFPDDVEEIDETTFEDFHDNRSTVKMPSEDYDVDVLQALSAKKQLGITLTSEDQKALDPNDLTAGITKNKKKKWSDRKAVMDVKILNRPAK